MPANRPFWDLLTRRNAPNDEATELYGRVVAMARAPAFYAVHGVPDTPEGRLEMIVLHIVLVQRRLGREGEGTLALARSLSDRFTADMDDCLREMGVGDIAVARKVKKAAAALFDRTRDYGRALAGGDRADLARLIGEHVLELGAPEAAASAGAERIAAYAFDVEAALTAAPLDAVVSGAVELPAPSD